MLYKDAWGNSIPISKINLYYSLGWMDSLSYRHYTSLKDKLTIEKRIKRTEIKLSKKLEEK